MTVLRACKVIRGAGGGEPLVLMPAPLPVHWLPVLSRILADSPGIAEPYTAIPPYPHLATLDGCLCSLPGRLVLVQIGE
jgi:hypothetical protein